MLVLVLFFYLFFFKLVYQTSSSILVWYVHISFGLGRRYTSRCGQCRTDRQVLPPVFVVVVKAHTAVVVPVVVAAVVSFQLV